MNANKLKNDIRNFGERLKVRFYESPETVLFALAAAVTAGAKVVDSVSGARSKQAYARKMNQSVKNDKKRR